MLQLFLADAAPAQGGSMQSLFIMGAVVLVFYFIVWRPEQKRRKAMETQRKSLKKGDRVTAMGIIGTVVRVQENSLILKMVDGSKIEVLKTAVTDVQPGVEEEPKAMETAPAEIVN